MPIDQRHGDGVLVGEPVIDFGVGLFVGDLAGLGANVVVGDAQGAGAGVVGQRIEVGLLNSLSATGFVMRADGTMLTAGTACQVSGSRMIWFWVRNWRESPLRQAAGATLAVAGPDVRCSVLS